MLMMTHDGGVLSAVDTLASDVGLCDTECGVARGDDARVVGGRLEVQRRVDTFSTVGVARVYGASVVIVAVGVSVVESGGWSVRVDALDADALVLGELVVVDESGGTCSVVLSGIAVPADAAGVAGNDRGDDLGR